MDSNPFSNPFADDQPADEPRPQSDNPYAAPLGDDYLGPYMPSEDGAWREGRVLIMLKSATLPPRCVKCNEATDSRLKRTLTWHHPLLYLLVLCSLWPYIIAAVIAQKTARIKVGLCRRHRIKRLKAIAIAWMLALSGIGFIVVGLKNKDASIMTFLTLAGGISLLAGVIYGVINAATVTAKRIDKQYVWLKGVCPEYLAELPDWIAPDDIR